MGFCRRCGDIVAGERCKCGGTAVAPVVAWNQGEPKNRTQDRWSQTYVSRDKSPTRPTVTTHATGNPTNNPPSPVKRFPRPISSSSSHGSDIGNRVSAHITSTTSNFSRPPSPLKHVTNVPVPEAGILPSLSSDTSSLAKVYGSVLQPKETLGTHSCAICSTPFLPDATIYPDPLEKDTTHQRFLCRPCFVDNGGSKGTCPSCKRPVLALKAEGGFVDAADKVWHTRCFKCDGCLKNIGDSPMLDLLGRPSCSDCFESCLNRDRTPRKTPVTSNTASPLANVGGMKQNRNIISKSREGSPALEELESRLGISKNRDISPELDELSNRLRMLGNKDKSFGSPRASPSSKVTSPCNMASPPSLSRSVESSPLSHRLARAGSEFSSPSKRFNSPGRDLESLTRCRGSPRQNEPPIDDAIEEMKRRFMKSLSSSPDGLRHTSSSGSLSLFPLDSASSPSYPPTPDLMSDFSDTATYSSLDPDSPSNRDSEYDSVVISQGDRGCKQDIYTPIFLQDIIEESPSQATTPHRTPTRLPSPFSPASKSPSVGLQKQTSPKAVSETSRCSKCFRLLFTKGRNSDYVTVACDDKPGSDVYHSECFTCTSCHKPFNTRGDSQALFVKDSAGPCHPECARPSRSQISKTPEPMSNKFYRPTTPSASPSRRADMAPRTTQTAASSSLFPRFGSKNACPGCLKSVSPMERGVVPGPSGTRWHANCLICGVTEGKSSAPVARGRQPRPKGQPGCGKKLDSAARSDTQGGLWCRECWLLLPLETRNPSPTASPSTSAMAPKLTSQYTGTTTIARQFTGVGAGEGSLLRQMTGGSTSPTRSLSPTKQLTHRQRPKSVIEMRGKSVDEGRGVFLIRQMTGNAGR